MAPNAGRPSGSVTAPLKDAALACETIPTEAQATRARRVGSRLFMALSFTPGAR
jgi:hypothetical protein